MSGIAEDTPETRRTWLANLRWAAEHAPAGLTLTIEPINRIGMPAYFLHRQAQAHELPTCWAQRIKLQLDPTTAGSVKAVSHCRTLPMRCNRSVGPCATGWRCGAAAGAVPGEFSPSWPPSAMLMAGTRWAEYRPPEQLQQAWPMVNLNGDSIRPTGDSVARRRKHMAAPLDTSIGHLLRFCENKRARRSAQDDLLRPFASKDPLLGTTCSALRRPGYLEHVPQDLTELGLVQPTEAEGRWRAAAAGGWWQATAAAMAVVVIGGNAPDGGDGPGRALREVLSHPYLLSYSSEDFDAH